MDEKDPIENKFKSAFSDYENEPPSRVWENLRAELHPLPTHVSFWTRMTKFSALLHLHPGFYFALSGFAFVTFLTVVYFVSTGHNTIRGHAYAGETRLSGGNAELFKVSDKIMPWDSVIHYRSAFIDHYGHFQFSQVKNGKYMLRVAPVENSEAAMNYLPSWFDRHETSDSGNVITIKGGDENIDTYLVKRKEIVK